MSEAPLIVTGFYANKRSYVKKRNFLDTWLKNTGGDVVIVDNAELPLKVDAPNVRVIRINKNLGCYEDHKGKFRPYLLGHAVAWMMGGFVAYSEGRDMIFKEQDCLWFGTPLEDLVNRAKVSGLIAQIGMALSTPSFVETALFWIKNDFIIEFITKYCEISEGDGMITTEEKFDRISRHDKRIVAISFGVGRDRPLPFDQRTWYAQRFTDNEIVELKKKGLI